MKASVVIPTKNGGEIFKKVIEKVLDQKTDFEFDIYIVDSGSKDGTVEFIESLPKNKVKFFQIQPKDFGHGKTRNYAVSKTNSEFVAFITQDALPYNENWLQNLIDSFKDPEVAGVFGKHLPYGDAYPVEKKAIVDHFDISFGKEFLKVKITNQADFDARHGWYVYYSDNNSAFRRSVWEKMPYPDVPMAEDQRWAELILKAGYAKAYNPDAVVYHSHRYSFKDIVKRYFDEYKFHVQAGNTKRAGKKDAIRFFINSYKYSVKVILTSPGINIFKKLYWIVFYIPYDIFRSYGYYLGTNYDKFPTDKYSMQQEIINK